MTVGEMSVQALRELILEVLDQREGQRNERKVLLSYKDVYELTGLSAPTIRKMVNRGDFPPPVTGMGKRGSDVRFLRSDVEKLRRA